MGSITKVTGKNLVKNAGRIDILTYSYPCQSLSPAGAFHNVNIGMSESTNSKSSLIWQIKRILLELEKLNWLPKYLLLENVPSITKRHIPEYKKWLNFLKSLNYSTNTQILNAKDFGIPQRRKRAFALSILNYKGSKVEKDEELPINIGGPSISYKESKKHRFKLSELIKEKSKYLEEYIDAVPNDTKSRRGMRTHNPKLRDKEIVRTITTKQDRHPNSGTINYKCKVNNKSEYRFLTTRESLILMGFDSSDKDKLDKAKISKALQYKQAGNSIVVDVLEAIFEEIYRIEKGER